MNTTDAYLIEIIKETFRGRYFFMDSECEIRMCRKLNVTPAKLRKLLDTAFDKGYIVYENNAFPWKIVPTYAGRMFAGIPAEEVAS